MKKLYTILLLLLFQNILAQENWPLDEEAQIKSYKEAMILIDKDDNVKTMRRLYFAYKKGKNTRLGKTALKKFDSILLITKTQLLKEIQGSWELQGSGSNWGEDPKNQRDLAEKMIINKKTIEFYKDGVLTKKEPLHFTETTYYGVQSYTTFDYSDGKIWSFKIIDNKTDNRVLHLKNEGYFKNGERWDISCGNTEIYYHQIN